MTKIAEERAGPKKAKESTTIKQNVQQQDGNNAFRTEVRVYPLILSRLKNLLKQVKKPSKLQRKLINQKTQTFKMPSSNFQTPATKIQVSETSLNLN